MSIDRIRCTCDQGTVVLPLNDIKIPRLIGLHDLDLVHTVRQDLIQNMQIETVSLFHLIQMSKQLCIRKAPVSGKYTVCPLTADRIGRLLHMADAFLKDVRTAPLVDWQFQADLRDRDITDTLSYAGHIHIALPSRLSLSVLILDDRRPELFVILSRRFFGCIDLFLIHLLHCIIIRFYYLCGIALVEYIADNGISRNTDACREHKNGKYGL